MRLPTPFFFVFLLHARRHSAEEASKVQHSLQFRLARLTVSFWSLVNYPMLNLLISRPMCSQEIPAASVGNLRCKSLSLLRESPPNGPPPQSPYLWAEPGGALSPNPPRHI